MTENPYAGAPRIADQLASLEYASGRDLALLTAALLDRIALAESTSGEDLPVVADVAVHAAEALAAHDGHPDVEHPLQYLRGRYRDRMNGPDPTH
ncbi:hypothetical protein ACFZBU_42080 [Embleya sp. NPDC008237]|uniref:hypothetical protein n=1 Tax=Embleya sp. NPDC008237 TaxID=3363978 RepID=UPI0036E81F68